jgi:hypothetical protein
MYLSVYKFICFPYLSGAEFYKAFTQSAYIYIYILVSYLLSLKSEWIIFWSHYIGKVESNSHTSSPQCQIMLKTNGPYCTTHVLRCLVVRWRKLPNGHNVRAPKMQYVISGAVSNSGQVAVSRKAFSRARSNLWDGVCHAALDSAVRDCINTLHQATPQEESWRYVCLAVGGHAIGLRYRIRLSWYVAFNHCR